MLLLFTAFHLTINQYVKEFILEQLQPSEYLLLGTPKKEQTSFKTNNKLGNKIRSQTETTNVYDY